jgi:hypothetical protein
MVMNCSEFEAEVQRLVEMRGASLSDAAETHRQACTECARLWQNHRMVEAALAAWRPVEVPANLTESVLRRLAEPSGVDGSSRADAVTVRIRSTSAPSQWGALLAAAACLVVSVWFGLAARPQNQDATARSHSALIGTAPGETVPITTEIAGRTASAQSNAPSVDVAESVVAVIDDLRGEYRELAEVTRETARDLVSVLPPTSPAAWMEEVASPGTAPATATGTDGLPEDQSPGAVSQIGRSIGDQIGQAIDFLRVAVPTTVPQG